MKELKQSETKVIKRSQINLNPQNPKRHTDKKVTQQKKNLQEVGYLGGVTWNEATGNIIDGHRRIKAMDLYFSYDGDNDYEIKVEAVSLDKKTEKEQMTYMALGNTKADYSLVADYANDIDLSKIGADDDELKAILSLSEKESIAVIDSLDDLIIPTQKEDEVEDEALNEAEEKTSAEELKQKVKETKQKTKEKAQERARNENAYITLSFSTYEAKAYLCELIGIDPDDANFAKGEDVIKLIE
ncbi:MAG: hypothetical protein R3Y50_05965 [Rikenellaceae bacterium]